ncbi:hypothetical protein AB0D27_43530 [Streptomyces sp. NPDC048415]|uniref:hypothetical protein n=1 Tax=Streptomyces sp. NPDC048415 TaxID=3154822 RepID=UPI00342D3ABF
MVTFGLIQRATQEFLAGMITHEVVIISLRYGLFDGRAWTLGGYGMRPLARERKRGHPALFMAAARHRGRLLRAELVAQRMVQDKVRLRGVCTDPEHELVALVAHRPGKPRPHRRLVHPRLRLIPDANQGAVVHAPLPTAPQPASSGGAAGPAEPSRLRAAGLASELLRPPPGCAAPGRRYLPVVEALLCASSFEWDETAAGWAAMPSG